MKRKKFTFGAIENLPRENDGEGEGENPITSRPLLQAFPKQWRTVRNGSYVYSRVVVCEEPLYRLARGHEKSSLR